MDGVASKYAPNAAGEGEWGQFRGEEEGVFEIRRTKVTTNCTVHPTVALSHPPTVMPSHPFQVQ